MQNNVFILDIETFPMELYAWRLGEQYLGTDNIKRDWSIAAWSVKRLGEPANSLIYRDTRKEKDPRNDRTILKDLWDVLNEADIVISQNGQAFDEPKIKARMMECNMKPYKPFKHYDTYKELKNIGFTSHKLGYLTDKFCAKYKKLSHKRFSGLSLWIGCLQGNLEAWNEMRKYNNYDVLSTEELYLATRGWSKEKATPFFYGNVKRQCKQCGAFRLTLQGKDRTAKKVFHSMQCQACGKYQRGEEIK